jgi:hypothetical protein
VVSAVNKKRRSSRVQRAYGSIADIPMSLRNREGIEKLRREEVFMMTCFEIVALIITQNRID